MTIRAEVLRAKRLSHRASLPSIRGLGDRRSMRENGTTAKRLAHGSAARKRSSYVRISDDGSRRRRISKVAR